MNRKTLSLAFSLVLVFGMMAYARGNSDKTANRTKSDANFVKMAAQDNMVEANLGEMAQQKSSNQNVKDFAQKLVNDHQQANQELTSVANQINVPMPQSISEKHQSEINRLSNLSGTEFDQQFLRHQVMDHEKAVAMFRHEAENAKNPQLKDYAAKVLPKLEDHLNTARELASQAGVNVPAKGHASREMQKH